MITNPSHEEIEALAKLNNLRDFIVFKEWLAKSIEHSLEAMADAESELAIRREQGAVRDMKEILNHANHARDYIEKFKR